MELCLQWFLPVSVLKARCIDTFFNSKNCITNLILLVNILKLVISPWKNPQVRPTNIFWSLDFWSSCIIACITVWCIEVATQLTVTHKSRHYYRRFTFFSNCINSLCMVRSKSSYKLSISLSCCSTFLESYARDNTLILRLNLVSRTIFAFYRKKIKGFPGTRLHQVKTHNSNLYEK